MILLYLVSIFFLLSCSNDSGTSSSNTHVNTSIQDECLQMVNEYRATENISPLSSASHEQATCTQNQADRDLKTGIAHDHFGYCNESAQNTAPSIKMQYYSDIDEILQQYLKMMWEDEKKLMLNGETEYQKIGHYLNMKNKNYTKLSCAISFNQDNSLAWINMNFFY